METDDKQALEAAVEMIGALKGTVEGLEMNLTRERDTNEGLKLTIESLQETNRKQEEQIMALTSQVPGGAEDLEDEQTKAALEKKLSFYYKDMKKIDPKAITAEDGETLFHILEYTFRALKKAGVEL